MKSRKRLKAQHLFSSRFLKVAKRKATAPKSAPKSKKKLADLLFADLEKLFKEEEKTKHVQRSKPREKLKVKTWERKKVVNPKSGESFTATKYKLSARTGYVESPLAIADKLESMREEIKKAVKAKFRRGEGLSLGYEFSFKFDPDVWEKNIINQTGYTNRVFVGGENLDNDLNFIMEEITERFSKYLERNHCLGVNLANIILEKTSAPKLSKDADGTEWEKLTKNTGKKLAKKSSKRVQKKKTKKDRSTNSRK